MSLRSRLFLSAAFGYVVLLYATSGVMRGVLNMLKASTGEGFPALAVGLCAVGLAGFVGWYRAPLKRIDTAGTLALVLVLAGYGLALAWLQVPEERVHLLQYGILAWLVSEGLRERFAAPRLHLLSLGIVIAAGIGDEAVQWLRPNRVGDLRDIVINIAAAGLAQGLLAITLSGRRYAPIER